MSISTDSKTTLSYDETLISMGYRQMTPKVWGKPVGYTLLIADLEQMLLTQHFRGSNQELFVWTRKFLPNEPERGLRVIKDFEAYEMKNGLEHGDGFNFLNLKEQLGQEL